MIHLENVFRYLVLLQLLFQIATTTLHVYHVCIQNDIISDLKPDPGLKLAGYVQLLLIGGEADDVQTLVTSAHQLCDTFYKAIVLEGSKMHHISADLSKAKLVGDVDSKAIKTLTKNVRPQFRMLQEHITFLQKEILVFLLQYSRTYDYIHDTSIGHKGIEFKLFDDYLRKRRKFAFQLDSKAESLRTEAKRNDDKASFAVMVVLFCVSYCIVLSVFCGKQLRFILFSFGFCITVLCTTYATIQLTRATELRVQADMISGDHYDLLKEVRRDQDDLFRSRNATLTYFLRTADLHLVKEAHTVLMTFKELAKRLHWIDASLHRMTSLAVRINPRMLEKTSRTILNDIKLALKNVTSNIETISGIL